MKKVITMLVLGVAILSTVMLGGCGKSDPTISKEKTPYAIVKEKNADGQYVAESYLTEKHPEIAKVKETVEGYLKAYNTMDYRTTDGMGTYGYLNDKKIQELKEKNDAAETVKYAKDNALVTQFDGVKIDAVYINKDMNKAEITGSTTFKFTEGTDAFFKNRKMQKDVLYKQDFLIQLEKTSDIWKVSYRNIYEAKPASN